MATVSACLIAKDEAEHLPRCLRSLAGAVDEVVLVDTGSRDATPALARAAGARVLEADWTGDFSAARNRSLDAARGAWCLVVDADEELPAETGAALRPEVERAAAAGLSALSLVMRNLNPPGDLATWSEFRIVRLFRRDPRHRYEGAIHEQVTGAIVRAGGRIGDSALRLLHHGYARKTAQGAVDRARRNLHALRRALHDRPDDPYLLYQLGATLKATGDAEAAREHLERALALDAAGPEAGSLSRDACAAARMRLAQLALGRRDDGVAAEEARRCLALDPGNVAALQILALGALGAGHADEARRALRTLLEAPSLSPTHRADVERLLALAERRR